ncbi:MAG: squalene synthase HpnD [Rhodospirillaceae bacterium]|nr:squalene synthase HpnD [Rhodospirillaceae bacterium]
MVSASPQARVRAIVQRSGTSFYWAMRLLPRPKQEAMFAVYAFCREVDDVADDEDAPPSLRLERLDAWRRALDALYRGHPDNPVTEALLPGVERYDLLREDFEAILAGMEMDATGPIVAPSRDELDLYCARVAGAVGLLSVKVFECRAATARDYALATGQALQLTNILRDLSEDAERGRLYLPADVLDTAGIETREPAAVLTHPALSDACSRLAADARARFAEAGMLRNAMPRADAAALWPAAIMAAIYRTTLDSLDRRGWSDVDVTVGPGSAAKLLIALRAGVTGS